MNENWEHQQQYLDQHAHDESHGLWWEQGTGKTRALIQNAIILYEAGKIDGVLIVAVPGGGDRNWVNKEIPEHCSVPYHAMFWNTAKSRTVWHQRKFDEFMARPGLLFLSMSAAAFMAEYGKKAAWRFFKSRRVMFIIDEPAWEGGIKDPNGKRGKSIVAAGKLALYRRAADGTPVAEGPFDFYNLARFLEPTYWKERELAPFSVFKAYFGRWLRRAQVQEEEGYDPGFDKLLGYRNLPELNQHLLAVGSRVLKENVLDLPPKVYMPPIRFEMTPEQWRLYNGMREDYLAEWEGGRSEVTLPIVQLLRFQQIACGYLPNDDEEGRMDLIMPLSKNPRFTYLEEIRDQPNRGKTIIWSRFRQDIDMMMEVLGKRAVRYDGAVSDDECERAKNDFQEGSADFICLSYAKGSTTITLHAARHVINHCNTFRLRHRLQSEDRAHRGGLRHSVDYSDVVANDTCDERTVEMLRRKRDISAEITGDELRAWL